MKDLKRFENIIKQISEQSQKILGMIKDSKRSVLFSDNTIHDVTQIIKEKKEFVSCIINSRSLENVPFFESVWSGDMYGESGIDGLELLLEDLIDQENNL